MLAAACCPSRTRQRVSTHTIRSHRGSGCPTSTSTSPNLDEGLLPAQQQQQRLRVGSAQPAARAAGNVLDGFGGRRPTPVAHSSVSPPRVAGQQWHWTMAVGVGGSAPAAG